MGNLKTIEQHTTEELKEKQEASRLLIEELELKLQATKVVNQHISVEITKRHAASQGSEEGSAYMGINSGTKVHRAFRVGDRLSIACKPNETIVWSFRGAGVRVITCARCSKS